jgi:hypothetical protein
MAATSNVSRQPNFRLANEKSRVPDTFQLGAISAATAFSASRFFDNLRIFNGREYSDSPRRHHLYNS